MASQATAGEETSVNSYTTGNQYESSMTALAKGGWIVTWASTGQDGSGDGVYQQRYAANGDKVGAEIQVNAATTHDQNSSSVTAFLDGGWVVTWTDNPDGLTDIHQQRYDANGAKIGVETTVNTYVNSVQYQSRVTALDDGSWVVTWTSYGQDGDSSQDFNNNLGVYQQRFAADGNTIGDETLVNTTTAAAQSLPDVATLADSGWVVTWMSESEDSSGENVYQQRYDSVGGKNGSETRVNTYTANNQGDSHVAALHDGGWIVTWQSLNQDGGSWGIYQQRYDELGNALDEEVRVNTHTLAIQANPSVAGLAKGGWVVAWVSDNANNGDYDIYQQRYDDDGKKVGNETRVNDTTEDTQYTPTVTALSDGSWVVSWTSDNQDGGGSGVYQRHFAPDITGTDAPETLTGTAWDEHLIGKDGDDTLDGKGGEDVMTGGKGDDTYIVDKVKDELEEEAGQGTDLVKASVSYTLGDNVENLTLTGSEPIDATGNDLANILTGNSADNKLTGSEGNDTLDGMGGNDVMIGGKGNDTYVVDDVHDDVQEDKGEGTDTARAALTWKLAANVENLVLTGAKANGGTGNSLDNDMTGNSGNNNLNAGAGNDMLDGKGGVDVMIGGTGNDVYVVDNVEDSVRELSSEGTDTVRACLSFSIARFAYVENLTLTGAKNINATGNTLANALTGNSGSNKLSGDLGNDTLDGGAGADTLTGGKGNDTYVVDNKGDKVVEKSGEGTDIVNASITYTLGSNVENLKLTGTAGVVGTGNSLDNTITGNSADNILSGVSGDDTLIGGGGKDSLLGGFGADRFVFLATGDSGSKASTRDVIVDFAHGTDRIDLHAIDANTILSGDQAFVLDARGSATSAVGRGHIGWYQDNQAGSANDVTILRINVDSDAAIEMTIELHGLITLTKSDFVL